MDYRKTWWKLTQSFDTYCYRHSLRQQLSRTSNKYFRIEADKITYFCVVKRIFHFSESYHSCCFRSSRRILSRYRCETAQTILLIIAWHTTITCVFHSKTDNNNIGTSNKCRTHNNQMIISDLRPYTVRFFMGRTSWKQASFVPVHKSFFDPK